MSTDAIALRLQLLRAGYTPIPVINKRPPFERWQKIENVSPEMLENWRLNWPRATNTGILTKYTPTLDVDILNEEAARTAEEHVREFYEERGHLLVRTGKAPKRALPFRTDEPFAKIAVTLVAPNGGTEKVEFLGDGQQVVCFGIHPDTGKAYSWHGGAPGQIAHEDLPYIREEEARRLVDELVEILIRDFGYRRLGEQREPDHNAGDGASAQGAATWSFAEDMRLRSALSAIPADERALAEKFGTSHEIWVKIGRALERLGWGERGYAVWRDWSAQSGEFDEEGLRTNWASFQRSRDARLNPVTIGTVFHYARQFGWSDQRHNGRDDNPPPWEPDEARGAGSGGAAKSPDVAIQILHQTEFLKGFVPPTYLVDNVLQRGFVYSLTAKTSGGKTAIALELTRAVGCEDPNATFGGHTVEKGKVLYLVGENADDVRARVKASNALRTDNPDNDRAYYIPGVFTLAQLRVRIEVEAQKLGGIDLVIVDTSAAYFPGDDENNNAQSGAHARAMRSLTKVLGTPCAIPLCHPAKWVNDPSQLVPRGGGAYLAEMDGNLTAWKHDDLINFHHGDKWRGPGFEPITFKIEKITTPKLVDGKGRKIPTVRVVAISEKEEAEESRRARNDEDRLLVALSDNPDRSHADLARACDFILPDGEPAKSRLQRTMGRLQQSKMARPYRDRWSLTEEGHKAVKALRAETIEDRGGSTTSRPFVAKVGKPCADTVPCIHCHKTEGVYKIADGRLPKGKAHSEALHEDCAEAWFTGQMPLKMSET